MSALVMFLLRFANFTATTRNVIWGSDWLFFYLIYLDLVLFCSRGALSVCGSLLCFVVLRGFFFAVWNVFL